MKRWRALLLCLLCLVICNTCFDQKQKRDQVEGEIIGFELGEDGELASFTIRMYNGKEREFSLDEFPAVFSVLEEVSGKDFRREPQMGASVRVMYNPWKRTALSVVITRLLEESAGTLSDGTVLNIMRGWNEYTYCLTDGTELLRVQGGSGPDSSYVGGIESFDDLSDTTKEKVLAYYEAQGLLYDEEAELERAYAAWREEGEEYACRMLDQNISPTASNDRVMYFLTSVQLPVEGRTYEELRLGAAFDRETGEHIGNLDLFTCPEEEAVDAILNAAEVPTQLLRTEMRAAFQPENLIFFPDSLEIVFPQGSLPSEEYAYHLSAKYSGPLREVLQDWAVPDPRDPS